MTLVRVVALLLAAWAVAASRRSEDTERLAMGLPPKSKSPSALSISLANARVTLSDQARYPGQGTVLY